MLSCDNHDWLGALIIYAAFKQLTPATVQKERKSAQVLQQCRLGRHRQKVMEIELSLGFSGCLCRERKEVQFGMQRQEAWMPHPGAYLTLSWVILSTTHYCMDS